MNKGKLIVLSGPSGAGKSTVINMVMEKRGNMCFSVSATTRAPRVGEVHGVNYFFIDDEKFDAMIKEDAFLEYAGYVGQRYGTPKAYVDEMLEQGKDVVLDIEVQGAMQIMEKVPEAITIFMMPPSLEELRTRLIHRGLDSMEKIEKRLERAREELPYIDRYQYFVLNDVAETAADEINSILTAEKCRTAARKNMIEVLLK